MNSDIYTIEKSYKKIIFYIVGGLFTLSLFTLLYISKPVKQDPNFLDKIDYQENLSFVYLKVNEKNFICMRDLYKISLNRLAKKEKIVFYFTFYIQIGKYYKYQFDSYYFEEEKLAKKWLNKLLKTNY